MNSRLHSIFNSRFKRVVFLIWAVILFITLALAVYCIHLANELKSDGYFAIAYDNCIRQKVAKEFNANVVTREQYIRDNKINDGIVIANTPEIQFIDNIYDKIVNERRFRHRIWHILFYQNDIEVALCVSRRTNNNKSLNINMIMPELMKMFVLLFIILILLVFGSTMWNVAGRPVLQWIKRGDK